MLKVWLTNSTSAPSLREKFHQLSGLEFPRVPAHQICHQINCLVGKILSTGLKTWWIFQQMYTGQNSNDSFDRIHVLLVGSPFWYICGYSTAYTGGNSTRLKRTPIAYLNLLASAYLLRDGRSEQALSETVTRTSPLLLPENPLTCSLL